MFEDIDDYINDENSEHSSSNSYNTQQREREIQANYSLKEERITLLKNYRKNDEADKYGEDEWWREMENII